ncbi:MAG TPA: integrin alpha [Myxococcota bacterium]|nr:integrin alpha [Myxococcota bacterium]
MALRLLILAPLVLVGCNGDVACGEGTHEEGGLCVPDSEEGDTDTDADGDTDADTDGDTDADTDADTDSDTDSDADQDGDGFTVDEDCDDTDADVNPDATDVLTRDMNCDGSISVDSLRWAEAELVGSTGDLAGFSVSSAGDVDGDGLDDVLVGAYLNDAGGEDAGAAHVVLGSTLAGSDEIDLSAADHSFIGDRAGETAGYAVASAGDVDGDGLGDFLIGAPRMDEVLDAIDSYGTAYLVLGDSVDGATTELSEADYIFTPQSAIATTGWSVASAGDVDGDGLADVFLGSKRGTSNYSAGQAHIFLGAKLSSTADLPLTWASHRIDGVGERAYFSATLAGGGDMDGDGLDEVIGGAYDTDTGNAYLFTGATLSSNTVFAATDADVVMLGLGNTRGGLALSGDVDGDGTADLMVGLPSSSRVCIWLTPDLADSTGSGCNGATHAIIGGNRLGISASYAGDVDGDGLDDVLLGADRDDDGGWSDQGKAHLIFGADIIRSGEVIDLTEDDVGASAMGEADQDYAGFSVSGAGDVDGNGSADLIVGAPQNDSGGAEAGKAYLLLSGW